MRACLLLSGVLVLGACSGNDPATSPAGAGPTVALAIVSGDGQSATAGSTLALTVKATDLQGRAYPTAPIAWSASSGSITQSTSADGNGVATASWTVAPPLGPARATATLLDAHGQAVTSVTFDATIFPAAGALVFRYIDVGSYHACGITPQEQMVCWGYNGDGQLPVGAGLDLSTPQPAADSLTLRIVSGGRYHTCAVTLSGGAYCWGQDRDARIGGGAPVKTTVSFQTVQSGLVHTCGISLSQQIWCWGFNGEGEIGVGPTTPVPGSVVPAPAFVRGDVRAEATGGLHTCVIGGNGAAQCWGENANGQLGDGSNTTSGVPVNVAGGITFKTAPDVVPHAPDPDFYVPAGAFITAGYAHTCAITTGDATFCWGNNENGQLGTGTTVSTNSPILVAGGLAWKALSGGFRHTCGLTTTGDLYCWGGNEFGQLGDGTTTERHTPTQIMAGTKFQSVSAGETSSCAVTVAGVGYCWGDNEYGQLGIGTHTPSLAPIKIANQP
jgi:hypothetical protein